ncbi:molybdenum cofactor guanylyltransferase [Hydrogenothermus marinus]|uniref:Probable molybdenum cofactor guanylyltransferase n=1 Tax=Hydrogenothermus marinus TaxID=133270 RepID=A0A3M0BL46_9AQUI|nr:molybdenum cofactor guanylyltransferase [Hydrogenothermus marinus]RMA97296.1 molybdenum cofactor guanylyltransferase [Hydrogenothermus marinus]
MNLDCILLAGGQSKRMGRDKAFLPFDNKTFLRNILETLDNVCQKIIIVVNKDFSLYENQIKDLSSNIILTKDINPYEGPLNGVISAKDYIKNDSVFIATCDTPIISTKIIKFLYENIEDYDTIIPNIDGKYQFLNTIYKKDSLEKAKQIYNSGIKSLKKWVDSLNKKIINKDILKKIDNNLLMYESINTPKDYKKFISNFKDS